jgi:hypothetical protein
MSGTDPLYRVDHCRANIPAAKIKVVITMIQIVVRRPYCPESTPYAESACDVIQNNQRGMKNSAAEITIASMIDKIAVVSIATFEGMNGNRQLCAARLSASACVAFSFSSSTCANSFTSVSKPGWGIGSP